MKRQFQKWKGGKNIKILAVPLEMGRKLKKIPIVEVLPETGLESINQNIVWETVKIYLICHFVSSKKGYGKIPIILKTNDMKGLVSLHKHRIGIRQIGCFALHQDCPP